MIVLQAGDPPGCDIFPHALFFSFSVADTSTYQLMGDVLQQFFAPPFHAHILCAKMEDAEWLALTEYVVFFVGRLMWHVNATRLEVFVSLVMYRLLEKTGRLELLQSMFLTEFFT